MTDFTPDKVAKGLRDVVAWETRVPPEVEVVTRIDGHEARVSLPLSSMGERKRTKLEKHLKALLPPGYHLKMTWTE